jgi:hypothetical protein
VSDMNASPKQIDEKSKSSPRKDEEGDFLE